MKVIRRKGNHKWANKVRVKRLRMYDGLKTSEKEKTGLRGEIIFGRGKHLVRYKNPYGQIATRLEFDEVIDKQSNIVTIGGYQFAFDKMFNIGIDQETTLRVGNLNDEAPMMKIGVQRSEYNSIYYDAETSISQSGIVTNSGVNIPATHAIFGFMMGDGGCKEDNITPIAPNYKDRSLFRAIPFRMSNDGAAMAEGKYYGKASTYQNISGSDAITSYYVKKFDDPAPHIVHAWVTDNEDELDIVDDSVFASTSSTAIESYIEMSISVDANDGRGFSTSVESSARVNEFGLVAGWYNPLKDDYENLQLITHFVRPNILLSEGDEIEAIYRLYAR